MNSHIRRAIPASLLLLLGATGRAGAQAAVEEFVGAFETAPGEYVAISTVAAGGNRLLLLADTRDDRLRLLFPLAGDTFMTGSAIADPSTPEHRVVFERTAGAVSALRLEPAAAGPMRRATRVPIALVPVTFMRADAVLEGTLYLPPSVAGAAAPPLIALAHGSEDNDRHSFGPLAWVFAAEGYAVLAYDKRGTGESTGSWRDAGIDELGADLAAAIETIARRPDIDRSRIAIVGMSEGGWVAARATRDTELVRTIVAVSGGGMTKGDAYVHKNRRLALEAGLAGTALDSAVAEARLTIDESRERVRRAAEPSGFDLRVTYDPAADWAAYGRPVLYLGGEVDALEDAPAAAAWLRRVFAEADNDRFVARVFPRAHHSLLLGNTGSPTEFRTLEGMSQLVPGYWDVLLRWLERHLARSADRIGRG